MSVPTLSYRKSADGAGAVDLDRLVTSRALIQANSGGGKSRAMRQLLEETHGRVQQLVIDPEGEFSSLRERFPYVLAAAHDGDVVANPKTARLLARKLMELGASAVLDLYDLDVAARREFVKLFLTELMHVPRELWRPLLVVIDEVHVFCPERGSGESSSTDAVITLATQGRKRGFCLVAATQRISKLHKDAAAELLNKLVGRTGLDVDVRRAGDELGFDKEQRAQLKQLTPGEFFAYGPALSQAVTKVRTGAVQTSHPEAGRVQAPPPPAPTAVRAMLAQLQDLPQQAEAEARSIDDLRMRNAKLEREVKQLTRAQASSSQQTVGKPVEKLVVDERAIARAVDQATMQLTRESSARERTRNKTLASVATTLDRAAARFTEAVALVTQSAIDLRQVVELPPIAPPASSTNGDGAHAPERGAKHLVGRDPVRASRPSPSSSRPPADGVTVPRQRILDALASFAALGIDAVEKSNVAVFADQSPTSSGFGNNLGALRSSGLIEYPRGGVVQLTDSGRAIAHAEPIGSVEELHRAWEAKLKRPMWRILEAVIAEYPGSVDRDDLAEMAGQSPSSSGYGNNLGALRSLGLIDKQPGRVGATRLLFPDGLA